MKTQGELESRIAVLKDLLRRALWYIGTDVQSSPPTKTEIKSFTKEVKDVMRESK